MSKYLENANRVLWRKLSAVLLKFFMSGMNWAGLWTRSNQKLVWVAGHRVGISWIMNFKSQIISHEHLLIVCFHEKNLLIKLDCKILSNEDICFMFFKDKYLEISRTQEVFSKLPVICDSTHWNGRGLKIFHLENVFFFNSVVLILLIIK